MCHVILMQHRAGVTAASASFYTLMKGLSSHTHTHLHGHTYACMHARTQKRLVVGMGPHTAEVKTKVKPASRVEG